MFYFIFCILNNIFNIFYIVCANASYLEHDYGFSLTVTYNNFAIINETVSGNIYLIENWNIDAILYIFIHFYIFHFNIFLARNPPPICVGEDIVDALEVEICLHIYNINIESDKFHACFEILLKALKIRITKVSLGCIDTKQYEQMQYIVDNTVSNLFHTNVTSNVSNISLPVDKMERMIAANSRSSLSSHSLTEVFLFFVLFYWISVAHGIILY